MGVDVSGGVGVGNIGVRWGWEGRCVAGPTKLT